MASMYLCSVLPASCRHNETIPDKTTCRQDAGSTLGVTSKHRQTDTPPFMPKTLKNKTN